jgi:hypothetical protein
MTRTPEQNEDTLHRAVEQAQRERWEPEDQPAPPEDREATIKRLAQDLIGSSGTGFSSIEEYMEEEGEIENMTIAELQMVDDIVFECTTCNWWCGEDEKEEDEASGQWVCTECLNEGKDDDDNG